MQEQRTVDMENQQLVRKEKVAPGRMMSTLLTVIIHSIIIIPTPKPKSGEYFMQLVASHYMLTFTMALQILWYAFSNQKTRFWGKPSQEAKLYENI